MSLLYKILANPNIFKIRICRISPSIHPTNTQTLEESVLMSPAPHWDQGSNSTRLYAIPHIYLCSSILISTCKYTEKMPTLALLKAPVRSSTFYQSIEKPFKHIVCVHIAGASRCLLRILCICHSLTVSMSILRNPNYLHLTKTARARRAEHRALISAE